MSSLRLAQAFVRAASPEGHDPLSGLPSLREHMRDAHGLDTAGMLPLRVLLHMHEDDHAGDPREAWHGSGDAARSPGFVAVRAG
jgi:hypothetical protein